MSQGGGSVSDWLKQLQAGDKGQAVEKLWKRYFQQLVGLANAKLGNLPRAAADEEDVALSAFQSFCQGAACGRFPELNDRTNLWRLLVTITARKAYQLNLSNSRQKRGGKVVLDDDVILEQILDKEPTPEFAVQAAEEYRRLLKQLDNEELRQVAQWKMEGYTNDEIAAKLDCAPRTAERRLLEIRAIWSESEKLRVS
jgi:RNA polymerase sigma factor (sigma-70 family)